MGKRRRCVLAAFAACLVAGVIGWLPSASASTTGLSGLRVVRNGAAAKLMWKAGSEHADVVERADSVSGPWTKIGRTHGVRRAGQSMTARDRGLEPTRNYWYRIDGGGVFSETVEGAVPTTTTTTGPGGREPVARWWKSFGQPANDAAIGIGTDANGNTTIGAMISGLVDFGSGSVGIANNTSAAIVQYASDGSVRWSRDLRATLSAVAVDQTTGDVTAAGAFGAPVDFGLGPVTPHSTVSTDIFVARYTGAGTLLWVYDLAPVHGAATVSSLAPTPDGGVAFTGNAVTREGILDLGTGPLPVPAVRGLLLGTFTRAGALQWLKVYASTSDTAGLGVAVDPAGNLAVAGTFSGKLVLDHSLSTPGTNRAGLLAEFDKTGVAMWSRRFGGLTDDRATAVATASNGDVVVTGYFGGSVDFGNGIPLTNPVSDAWGVPVNEQDIFLARYSHAGAYEWAKNFVPQHPDGNGAISNAVAVDSAGDIALTGSIINDVDFGTGALLGVIHNIDVFVARFDARGTARWAGRYGAEWDDRASGVAFTADDGVAVDGKYAQRIGPFSYAQDVENGFVVSFAP